MTVPVLTGLVTLTVGEVVTDFAHVRSSYAVTPDDILRVAILRGATAAVAARRATLTYGEVGFLIGMPSRACARTLDLLYVDCVRRAEPGLPAVVINRETGLCGPGFVGDDARERALLYKYWATGL